jgi:hypothetical protein
LTASMYDCLRPLSALFFLTAHCAAVFLFPGQVRVDDMSGRRMRAHILSPISSALFLYSLLFVLFASLLPSAQFLCRTR